MNAKGKMLGLLAMAAMFEGGAMSTGRKSWEFDETNVSGKKAKVPTPKGVQKFIIEGKEIFALNRKNAIRKANKLTNTPSPVTK